MKLKTVIVAFCLALPVLLMAQTEPTIDPQGIFTPPSGETEGPQTEFSGSAPVVAQLNANAENTSGWDAHYEWRFTMDGDTVPYLIRYEENTEYTFTKSGTHRIELYATFTQGSDVVEYTAEYWQDATPITVTISESKLNMPNAFSPNGDGINDVYKAKEGWQSLVEFHAYIYNRWGKMLYEWTDPSQGWDGKYKGKDCKQGVYFCLVKAKGADGRRFNIKTDVNLLRGYTEKATNE